MAEAARNVACAGARRSALTNCLNFGNPERPEIMWQFAEAVAASPRPAARSTCPITGGNVSFYNETDGQAILPDAGPRHGRRCSTTRRRCSAAVVHRAEGAEIVLLGDDAAELGGSEYLHRVHGAGARPPPALDLGAERALQQLLATAIARGPAGLGARLRRGRAGGGARGVLLR